MHFGRVEDLTGIDLSLPADAPRTTGLLKLAWGGKGRVHAGCPVWTNADWVGSLYPEGTKPADYLAAYAEQLGTVELNSTFYHLVDAARIGAWRDRVPASFRFCPKVYRGVSEHLGSSNLPGLVRDVTAGFSAFRDRYGLGFMQLPEGFGPDELPLLQRFLGLWPRALPLAVEFRHPGSRIRPGAGTSSTRRTASRG